jgi:asparagine synthase (glutamine-hydrolysing)
MCGIAGILHWGRNPGRNVIEDMTSALKHRGPDASGIEELNEISLGHRRLSIIDLSDNARQPMVNAGGHFHIVFNGEIYNFNELRQELLALGYSFSTRSDTEVVLNAYEAWGPECLNRFNGMFAIAIWDVRKKELFLARDRFGKKPLYYSFTDTRELLFASELTALTKHPKFRKEYSTEALNCYLALGYILAPLSLYQSAFKLEQASYMIVSNGGENIIRKTYWDYASYFRNKPVISENDAAAHILDLLEDAVRVRMVGDVPIGAFLSGGVDSSSIVACMKKLKSDDLHTFSIGFEDESYNELEDANRMAAYLHTIHEGYTVKSEGIERLIAESVAAFDEPFADNSMIPMMEVSSLARKKVTVVLSGDGADELFAGYITYKADKYYHKARLIPAPMRRLALQLLKRKRIHGPQKINTQYKMRQFLHGSMYGFAEAHYSWRLFFHPEERIAILGEEHRELVYDTDPVKVFKKFFDRVPDLHWLDQSLYVDGMTWLADDILVKSDRTTMHYGLEARAPYLDFRLAEYAASLPPDMKLKGLQTKYILKKALKNVLPEEVLHKKKSGFNAPVGNWIGVKGSSDEFRSFNKFVFDTRLNYGAKKTK